MRRPWQYTLLGAAIAVFILYGIELSSEGIEDVYGPRETRAVRTAAGADGHGYAGDPYAADRRAAVQEDPYGMRPDGASGDAYGYGGATGADGFAERDGLLDRDGYGGLPRNPGYGGYGYDYGYGGSSGRLADGAAGLLQSAAKGGIRFIVSLFESVAQ